MDTLRSMYVEYLERAHSALAHLDRYLMLHPKPLADAAQRILDNMTEDVMQLIAGGIAIREEEEVNGYHPIDDEIDAAVYAVESHQDAQADAYEEQRKRADFFRDALADLATCPKVALKPECIYRPYECVHLVDDNPDYASCWDEVERGQR
jgi:hypothetical protein